MSSKRGLIHIVALMAMSGLFAGCAQLPPQEVIPEQAYNPAADARLRVIDAGNPIWIFPDADTAQLHESHQSGRQGMLAITKPTNSLFHRKPVYRHIGMPVVNNETIAWGQYPFRSLTGKPGPILTIGKHYNEFVIPANVSVTIKGFQAESDYYDPIQYTTIMLTPACGPAFLTFKAEPGHDYEVYMNPYDPGWGSTDDCNLHLREIVRTTNGFTALMMPVIGVGKPAGEK